MNDNLNMFCKFLASHYADMAKWRIQISKKRGGLKKFATIPSPSDFDSLPYPWVMVPPFFYQVTAKGCKRDYQYALDHFLTRDINPSTLTF